MRHVAITALIAAAWAVSGTSAIAACARSESGIDVAVGVENAPPFVVADPTGNWTGLSFELWSGIARDLQTSGRIGRTEFVVCPLGEQLRALAAGTIDVVISPVTITADRMALYDFTHQYLGSGVTVAQRRAGGIDFGHAAGILRDTFGQPGASRTTVSLLGIGLVGAALRAGVGRRQREAAGRIFGVHASIAARALGIVGAGVVALLAAAALGVLTAALAGSIGGNRAPAMDDLPWLRLATLVGSSGQSLVEDVLARAQVPASGRADPREAGPQAGPPLARRVERVSGMLRPRGACIPHAVATTAARCVSTADWSEAMAMLAAGEVDAVVGDWAELAALARLPGYAGRLEVQGAVFRLEPYGWAVSARRPDLRAEIDRALVQRLGSPQWRQVVESYFGGGILLP